MALSDTKIRSTKPTDKPYKLADGGGLYLLITPAGGKLWRLKYRFEGKEKLRVVRPTRIRGAFCNRGSVQPVTVTDTEEQPESFIKAPWIELQCFSASLAGPFCFR